MKTIAPRTTLSRIVGIAFVIALLCTMIGSPQAAQATSNGLSGPGWVIVATQMKIQDSDDIEGNNYYNAIYTMNTYTNEVHGPFLMNELSPINPDPDWPYPQGMDLFDVALTPDGKTAIVSAFGQKTIFFVDVSDPLQPEFLSSVKLDIYAEDIAITADGRYALVTDGGFTTSVYTLDIQSQELIYELVLPTIDHDTVGNPIYGTTNAVAVAPDGTVVMADYFHGAIHTLRINSEGALTYTGTHRYYLSATGEVSLTAAENYQPSRPVNVAIAPDGVTVLVSDTLNYVDINQPQYTNQYPVGVYRITQPGKLAFVQVVTGLPRAMQTINFTESGDRAIMLGNFGHSYDSDLTEPDSFQPDGLYVMDILGPGQVAFNPTQYVNFGHSTTSQLFGVDGLAVYEGKAYASYPTISIDYTLYPERYLSIVDLTTFELTEVDWGPAEERIPVGVAVRQFIPQQVFLPSILN